MNTKKAEPTIFKEDLKRGETYWWVCCKCNKACYLYVENNIHKTDCNCEDCKDYKQAIKDSM
jgi:hypothetical protein